VPIHRTVDPYRVGNLVIENYAHSNASLGDRIEPAEIETILRDFAIVVCTKDEPLPVLEGVLEAIPPTCDCLVVSGSESPRGEMELIDAMCGRSVEERRIWQVHQFSAEVAGRVRACGLDALLTEREGEQRVADGKGEGLVIGVLGAAGLEKRYVGFIDADNHAPESAAQYVDLFARGMAARQTERCMVRLRWLGKRGPEGNRQEWGRASRISNAIFSEAVASHLGIEGKPITTGNAGEFAMTMTSALETDWTSGYGAESFLLLQYLEAAIEEGDAAPELEITQILTSCDHCHTQKSESHIARIIHQSLLPLWLSPIADESLKAKIEPHLESPNRNGNRSYRRYPAIASAGIARAREIFSDFLTESASVPL